MLADSKMETDGILQTLIIHTSFLELQITLQVLQYQSVELLQEHYAKFTLNLNNSALPSTVPRETLISMLKSLVSNAFHNKYTMKHTLSDTFL